MTAVADCKENICLNVIYNLLAIDYIQMFGQHVGHILKIVAVKGYLGAIHPPFGGFRFSPK